MSKHIQDKFFEILEARAKDLGLELIINHEWANTGNFSLQYPNDFNSLITCTYQFNSTYAKIGDTAAWYDSSGKHTLDEIINSIINEVANP